MSRSLDHLYEPFREKVQDIYDGLVHWCLKHRPGSTPLITQTFRSQAEQDALYAKGRTKPGPKVTNAKVSNHTSCLAVDFVLANEKGQPVWGDDDFWSYYGHLARAKNLKWGGDWISFKDKPHVEWPQSDAVTYRKARAWAKQKGLK